MVEKAVSQKLLWLARESIEYFFDTKNTIPYEKVKLSSDMRKSLECRMPLFVVLKKKNEIRGMSGLFDVSEEVGRLVCQLAVNAAFFDTKHPRLKPYELNEIGISLIFPKSMQKIPGQKSGAIAQFQQSKRGVYLSSRGRFSYALPHTWEEIADAEVLVRMLLAQLGITRKNGDSAVEYYEFCTEEASEII